MAWPPDDLLVGPAKPIALAVDEENECRRCWSLLVKTGEYDCELPKWQFLCWATDYQGVLAHGSNDRAIERFEPRDQTDWFGRVVRRVFATPDGIWPMYFAIVDRSRYVGSLRNLYVIDEQHRRRYWFSINGEFLGDPPLTGGAVYLLPGESFSATVGEDGEVTEEWSSPHAVEPIARVDVESEDFPFLNQIAGHDDRESARLVELQPVVLTRLERIDARQDSFHLVVPRAVAAEAAELAVLLSSAGIHNTTFPFDDEGSAIVVGGPGASNLVAAIRRSFVDANNSSAS